MQIDIITIFPEYFGPLSVSLIGKAAERGDISFTVHDLRRWTYDVHHTVDDSPFGGGPGMVMKPEPWGEALDSIAPAGADPLLVIPTPAGLPFSQQRAARYASEPWLIFACGRYEGIDGRVADDARSRMRVEEVSIGDYVLAGGEPAVLVMIEAICRLLPGVLGNAESAADDSFGFGASSDAVPLHALVVAPVGVAPGVQGNQFHSAPGSLVERDGGGQLRCRRTINANYHRKCPGLQG